MAKKYIAFLLLIIPFLACSKRAPENLPQFESEKVVKTNKPKTPEYTVKVKRQFMHNTASYTQGLLLSGGFLYESTGLKHHSTLQKIDPATGKVLITKYLGEDYFGEGLALHSGKLYQLTWMEGTCFEYDAKSLNMMRTFSYFGEGWGMASDGEKLFMSDGSFVIKIVDPKTFKLIGSKSIYFADGSPCYYLNEMEFADGYLWANIWQKDMIVKIDTAQSLIVGIVDISPLRELEKYNIDAEVSNGIAYNEKTKTFILTGKYWSQFYEVELVEKK